MRLYCSQPVLEQLAVLVEDLNPVVRPIGDEQPAFRVPRERVRLVELARACAALAPLLDELAGAIELADAGVRSRAGQWPSQTKISPAAFVMTSFGW